MWVKEVKEVTPNRGPVRTRVSILVGVPDEMWVKEVKEIRQIGVL